MFLYLQCYSAVDLLTRVAFGKFEACMDSAAIAEMMKFIRSKPQLAAPALPLKRSLTLDDRNSATVVHSHVGPTHGWWQLPRQTIR
jgi:hypothetical protein